MHAKTNRCFSACPFEGSCPLLGGSVKRDSTVYNTITIIIIIIHIFLLLLFYTKLIID